MKLFNLLLNIIWLVFCGIWMAIGYAIAALICFILIITIPFGIASLRIAGFVLWPFGRTTVDRPDAGAGSFIGNVIWVIFAGWWLALAHLVTSIPLFLSIIGIPFGWANLKLIPISLMPLGREVVATDQQFGER
ncbi:YccF domain-containing protein [Streptomyces mirabilis]|uniref:YccF domain-containing protein n=1 Tax=Streptomyces mirabilis TaxID=68239 RepID=UPI00224D46B7|nr:YccF domain-containing protein [Streptomyces mirabilis]MCX4422200.1 YccF domain-containing protein [Streptomyces mirabilis]